MNSMFIYCVNFLTYQIMMKWIVILFLEFFMYSQVQTLVICNNHECDVLMNGSVMFVET